MDVRSQCDDMGLKYDWADNADAFKAQVQAIQHAMPTGCVIKPIVIRADGEYVVCAIPSCHTLNLEQIRLQLGVQEVALASDDEIARLRAEAHEEGESPIGWLYGLPTLMDERLVDERNVTFQAGGEGSATMSFLAFFRLAKPVIGRIALQQPLAEGQHYCSSPNSPHGHCLRRRNS